MNPKLHHIFRHSGHQLALFAKQKIQTKQSHKQWMNLIKHRNKVEKQVKGNLNLSKKLSSGDGGKYVAIT